MMSSYEYLLYVAERVIDERQKRTGVTYPVGAATQAANAALPLIDDGADAEALTEFLVATMEGLERHSSALDGSIG